MNVKYPEINIALTEMDGNAFSILSVVIRQLKRAGVDQAERDEYHREATSGGYDHLVMTTMRWVEVS
jgi:hypothetical protein